MVINEHQFFEKLKEPFLQFLNRDERSESECIKLWGRSLDYFIRSGLCEIGDMKEGVGRIVYLTDYGRATLGRKH